MKLSSTNPGLLSHFRISIKIYDVGVTHLLRLSVLVTAVALNALALVADKMALFKACTKRDDETQGFLCNKTSNQARIPTHQAYSAFANSCPLQTDTFLFPLIHSHHVLLSSNKF